MRNQYRPRRFVCTCFLCLALLVVPGHATPPRALAAPEAGGWQCWDDGTPDPCHTTLRAMAVVSPDDVWAAGGNGRILHRYGGVWAQVPSPTTGTLYAMAMTSPTDG